MAKRRRWQWLVRLVGCVLVLGATLPTAPAAACSGDGDCAADQRCFGLAECGSGVCAPALALDRFPIDLPPVTPYTAELVSVLDHSGRFYQQCCDTEIVAFTGETARREDGASLCPAPPEFPTCFFAPNCICGYAHPSGGTYVVNGNYVGALLGPGELSYDGHAGYDYRYPSGTPLIALRDGVLCKAQEDVINGRLGAASAWDKFHTFYVDHGTLAGSGYATWYLHATDLAGAALQALAPGQCAPVAGGQVVASVGNVGTFLPHLHFEVRTYVPGEGPEGSGSRVIDPYGWTGSGADPWSDPLVNPQASPRQQPFWVACGNGRVECGEQCDDGNVRDGDCCSATCAPEPAGQACDDGNACTFDTCDGAGICSGAARPAETECDADGSVCTPDRCDAGGTCVPAPAISCPTCERCDAALGCVAEVMTGCRAAPRSLLGLRPPLGGRSARLVWRWTQGETPAAEFGDPRAGDGYTACLFAAGASPTALFAARVPPAGTCPSGTSRQCWRAGGPPGHFTYRDQTGNAAGIDRLVLRAGGAGAAAILIRGRGASLTLPPLPVAPPILLQMRADNGHCWEAPFDAPTLRVNRADLLRAKVD